LLHGTHFPFSLSLHTSNCKIKLPVPKPRKIQISQNKDIFGGIIIYFKLKN
jgi:hypothetical protein